MSRLAAEERYRQRRRRAFDAAANLLEGSLGNLAGKLLLREIDAPLSLEVTQLAWSAHPARCVQWNWPSLIRSFRQHPARLELAVWYENELCALALGRPSNSRSHCSLHYIEGSPDPAHVLKGHILAIVLTVLERYSVALGAEEMRIDNPLSGVRRIYMERFGFVPFQPPGQVPYLSRKVMV